MVNNGDVKSLLMRLHDGLQMSGAKDDGPSGTSFAASLGELLDAAAAGEASANRPTKDGIAGAAPVKSEPVHIDAHEAAIDAESDSGSSLEELDAAAAPGVSVQGPAKPVNTELQTAAVVADDRKAAKSASSKLPVDGEAEMEAKHLKGKGQKLPGNAGTFIGDVQMQKPLAVASTGQEIPNVGLSVAIPQRADEVDGKTVSAALDQPQSVSMTAPKSTMTKGATKSAPGTVIGKPDGVVTSDKPGVSGVAQDRGESSGVEANKMPAKFHDELGAAVGGEHAVLMPNTVAPQPSETQIHNAVSAKAQSVPSEAYTNSSGQFDALRRGEPVAMEKAIVTTPSTLEVGIADVGRGWVKIRAELTDAGTVTAALSSNTAAGMQTLHRDLPALTSFLDGEQVPVSSLVVHHAESSGFFAGTDSGGRAGGQQAQQEDRGRDGQHVSLDSDVAGAMEGLLEITAGEGPSVGGGWLSVRA